MPAGTIAIGQNANDTLQIFAAGFCSSKLFTSSQAPAAASGQAPAAAWGPWSIIGGAPDFVRQFAIGRDNNGQIDGFALTTKGQCYHIQQTAPNGTTFQWTDIGAVGWQQIALARNAD